MGFSFSFSSYAQFNLEKTFLSEAAEKQASRDSTPYRFSFVVEYNLYSKGISPPFNSNLFKINS
jgi:hypothetical protein